MLEHILSVTITENNQPIALLSWEDEGKLLYGILCYSIKHKIYYIDIEGNRPSLGTIEELPTLEFWNIVKSWKKVYSNSVIVASAVKFTNGLYIVGARHGDIFMHSQMQAAGIQKWENVVQGFIDNYNQFLDRNEAYALAIYNHQYKRGYGASQKFLYSEDIY